MSSTKLVWFNFKNILKNIVIDEDLYKKAKCSFEEIISPMDIDKITEEEYQIMKFFYIAGYSASGYSCAARR